MACGAATEPGEWEGDASRDGAREASVDAEVDAGVDAGVDASVDATRDVALDGVSQPDGPVPIYGAPPAPSGQRRARHE
jgi:hypothetical protein